MQYAFLIYCDDATEPSPGTKDYDSCLGAYFAFPDELKAKGIHKDSAAFQPAATATTVRVREGQVLTTDGPFAETKEQLGGLYFLECKDLDEALEQAARIPAARHGFVEIRPVRPFER